MADNKIAYMTTGVPTYRDYMFLASMIRVRARNMVTFDRLEQMLRSGSFEDAARLLAEAGWPNVSEMSAGSGSSKTSAGSCRRTSWWRSSA